MNLIQINLMLHSLRIVEKLIYCQIKYLNKNVCIFKNGSLNMLIHLSFIFQILL